MNFKPSTIAHIDHTIEDDQDIILDSFERVFGAVKIQLAKTSTVNGFVDLMWATSESSDGAICRISVIGDNPVHVRSVVNAWEQYLNGDIDL